MTSPHILILIIQLFQLGWVLGYGEYDKYPLEKGVHVIDKGERKDGDSKLYSETLREKGNSYDDYDEYCYPPKSSTDQIRITEYEVKDQDEADKGGLAFEVSGGEGQGQVCFVLKARYHRSYHYKVDVYGYRLVNGVIVKENMGGGIGTGSFGTPGGVGSGYGAVGSRYGAVNSDYGAVNSGYGNTGALNNNNFGGNNGQSSFRNVPIYDTTNPTRGYGSANPIGGYGSGNPIGGYGSGNPSGGYGSGNPGDYGYGFQQNNIGNTGYGQNQPYGSGNIFDPTSRGPFKK